MMTNIFSMFDPSTSMKLSMNWLSSMIMIFTIPNMFWLIPSRYTLFILIFMNKMNNEFNSILNNKFNKLNNLVFISFMMFIIFNNFMGLFPFIFTSSSHLVFSMSIAIPLWMSLMIFGWMKNTKNMLYHQTPMGTPYILMPFMVIIEFISNIIRPITLSVRLSANMIAGHLLLTLMSNNLNNLSISISSMIIILQSTLLILECAVSIIQSYVFTILSTLYSSETN
uniref:ATP synthase subunit a n=1 Tax=Schlettererius cinctipes TaxID=32424 RepID=C4NCF9_9HYME|nr:ATP synthase F0 subunit 6 [Schlettererius cinctipes]